MSLDAQYYAAFIKRIAADPDTTLLDRMAERLAEAEDAMATLRAKGWGQAGTSLAEVAKCVPENAKQVLANLFGGGK